jgi:plasmid stability protein
MATLNVRNLPEKTQAQLRLRAAKSGRSMEAEARDLIARACVSPRGRAKPAHLQSFVESLYGRAKPKHVVEELIAQRRREAAEE